AGAADARPAAGPRSRRADVIGPIDAAARLDRRRAAASVSRADRLVRGHRDAVGGHRVVWRARLRRRPAHSRDWYQARAWREARGSAAHGDGARRAPRGDRSGSWPGGSGAGEPRAAIAIVRSRTD